ncbi:hypothetical protein [Methylomicrobium sp. Wu6]|uniref:COG4648 family protein n=1 Tax=Methylomicrobium sp. Wu6 TaxID=3107928 RepID=UPI002DD62A0C|nr:hypothetical protein [Methylomicrobium sp. Wu6]MEC4747112.1 hypothetical protein [Methylomicrobium sp. Wu6]
MRPLINIVIGFLTIAYPFAVYFGIQYFEPWKIAAVLIGLLVIRQAFGGVKALGSRLIVIAGMIFCALAIWRNDPITLRFYPVMMNGALLTLFAWSLFHPPTVIERLARLRHPDLPPSGVAYTRRVTQVWCGFFMVNGGIALATALWSSFEIWSLYNGLIAYLLMGTLFGGEYLVRIRTQKHAG